jgi:GxxExxY protein
MDVEAIARSAVDCGYKAHRELGPGLLESVYEAVLSRWLQRSGHVVERQVPISFAFDGMMFADAFRVDLLVDQRFVIEINLVERQSTFKDGVHRVVSSKAASLTPLAG